MLGNTRGAFPPRERPFGKERSLTVVQESLDVEEDVREGRQLFLILEQLPQVVGDTLGVVVERVAHLH